MVETVIKHLTEFKQMTEAAIPFRLLNEQGEINCSTLWQDTRQELNR